MFQSDFFVYSYPYWDWECYQDGMWNNRKAEKRNVSRARFVLSNRNLCLEAMRLAVLNYPNSAMHHLSKFNLNRHPWMGQSACCFLVGTTEEETRLAWNTLSIKEQDIANNISQTVIDAWERKCLKDL